MPGLMRGAEPFYLPGSPVGALMLHGFTGAPREMRPLAEALAGAGLSVLAPRLTHHGTQPTDMFRSTWPDWLASALDGYHLLGGQCPTVFVMGLSMGGVLALQLAARCPMAGVVAMSAPSRPLVAGMPRSARYTRWLSVFRPFVDKGPPDQEADPEHVQYPRYPVRAIGQLRALIENTAELLPQVKVPALLVHSRGDTGVALTNLDYIAAHLGSPDKSLLVLERSGHVVTEGPERAWLCERVLSFVRAHCPSAPA